MEGAWEPEGDMSCTFAFPSNRDSGAKLSLEYHLMGDVIGCSVVSNRKYSQALTFDCCFCAGAVFDHAQQPAHFDLSIGLPLPGSLGSWEPFNAASLPLSAEDFTHSPEPPGIDSPWGSEVCWLDASKPRMQQREQGVQHASSAADVSSGTAKHDMSAMAVSTDMCWESSPQGNECLSGAATPERVPPWADHTSR